MKVCGTGPLLQVTFLVGLVAAVTQVTGKNLEPAASTTVTAAVTAAVVQDDGVRIEYKIEKLMTPLLYQILKASGHDAFAEATVNAFVEPDSFHFIQETSVQTPVDSKPTTVLADESTIPETTTVPETLPTPTVEVPNPDSVIGNSPLLRGVEKRKEAEQDKLPELIQTLREYLRAKKEN